MKILNKLLSPVYKKLMISCDKSGYLSSKARDAKLNMRERLELKIHLSVCKYCLQYKEQIDFIGVQLNNYDKVMEFHLHHHLTDEQKNKMKDEIKHHLNHP